MKHTIITLCIMLIVECFAGIDKNAERMAINF